MHAKIYVAQCDVGKGVFAAQRFRAGERILRFVGPKVDHNDPINYSAEGANLLQVGHDAYILPRPKGLFVNHSCRPNAGLHGTRTLVALQDIEPGEEIRFDYSTTMDEDYWTMECMCRHPECRGVVRDFRYLPEPLREHYVALRIVPAFVRRSVKVQQPARPAGRVLALRGVAR